MASPDHAPAGRYAREALKRAGLWDRLTARMIHADNVRFAARYVAHGAVQVGIVYATDARVARSAIVAFTVPIAEQPRIRYVAARVARAPESALAGAFLEFLRGAKTRAWLEEAGFLAP